MKKILSILSVILFTGSLWTANAAPAEGTYWKETFSSVGTVSDWTKKNTNKTGDNGIYYWSFYNFKRNENVGGETAIRLGYASTNYIMFQSNHEGGIKGLYFKWNNTNTTINCKIEILNNSTSITTRSIDKVPETAAPHEFEDMTFNVKQNAKLKIYLQNSSPSIVIGPISIIPYLLFTNKKPSVDITSEVTSFDLKTIWINNTTSETPITYSVSKNTTGGEPTITNGVVDLSNVTTSGSMIITANWGNVSTTTTLSVTLPTPTVTLENAEVALNGSYKPQPLVTVGGTEVSDPEISYASNNISVATVDESGKFTLLGSGTSTITATVAAKAGVYQQAKKDITLTVAAAAPEDGKFWKETFSNVGTVGDWKKSNTDVVGDSSVYAWSLNNFKRNGETVGDEPGVRLGYNKDYINYIMFNDNQEGGIKDLYFKWAPGGSKSVTYKIEVTGNGLSTVTRTITSPTYECAQKINVEQNAKLKISMQSGSEVAVFGPISVVPYLLFTNKTPKVDASAVDTFDLKKILINNTTGDAPTFAVTENTTGSAAKITNGVIALNDVKASGSMKITATWGSVTTTTTLAVAAIPTPTIELENAEVAINGSYVPQPVVKIGETTVQNPTITYTSSNANVATVEGSTFTLLGTGTTTITATVAAKDNEYKQAQKEITLTVTAVAPAEGMFWKETFSKMGTVKTCNAERTPVAGDSSVYSWQARNYMRNETIDGEMAVRLRCSDKSNYVEFDGNQEGGIKDLYFKIGSSSGKSVTYKIEVSGNGLSTITRTITGTTKECAQKINVAQNAKLKIYVQDGSDAVVFGPISVVPYLLFTNKAPQVNISPSVTSFDLNTILINNTTGEVPTYEVSENSTGSAATITDGVIALNDVVTSGTMKIKATWGKVTTTTTLTVTLPTPTIEMENAEVAINGSYVPQPVVKIGETVVENPSITYTSSNTSVATVDGSTFTLLGTGTTTITATVAAKDYAYQQAKKDITLTVTAVAPEEGTFWKETFSKLADADGYVYTEPTPVTGDSSVYAWSMRNYRHKNHNDDKVDGERGVRIAYKDANTNNYIEFKGNQEGGIKDLYFKWVQAGSKVNYKIEITGEGLSTVTRTITGAPYVCAQKLNVAQNAKLKIYVTSSGDGIVFGPISVVPYLLYTQKTDTLDLATATTSKNEALIDNRTDANAIEYSIVSGDATIDEKGTVTTTTVGTVKVQAKWGDVTTTYNLKVINTSQYNLTWNADGGELSGGTPAGLVTVGDALEAPTATKVGYNHTGWDPEVPEVMPANDVTYKATYTAKTCNITLKSNYEGGADDIEFVATYKETSPVTSQAELFTRTGYTIKEGFWKNAESEASGERWVNKTGEYTKGVNGYTDDNRKWIHDAEEDITLYAHWQATSYTITYANMNGATNFEGAPATYTIESSTITLGTPTKTGYNFAGWKVTNAQGEEITEIAQGSTGNKTLWAVWTAKKCNITLKSNYVGGAEDIKFVATYGETSPVAGSAELFTRTNYTIKEGFWKNAESEASGERWVNKTGEYTKSVNGYTDANRKWIHDAEEDITLYAHWTSTMPNISLNDGEDNSATIAANEGKTANVTTNRKVTGGMFNTICLPFDVDAEQMATVFGEDYQLVEFTSATLNEGKNELNIRFNTVEDLVAGVPYLIKTSATKENISFTEVQIENTTGSSVGADIKMYGIMSPTVLEASEKTHLIVVANDKLSWVTANDTQSLKGMRAYLKVENEQVQAAIRRNNPRLVLNGTDTATEMLNVNANANANRKLLINGQLYIEHNDRLYNVLGY